MMNDTPKNGFLPRKTFFFVMGILVMASTSPGPTLPTNRLTAAPAMSYASLSVAADIALRSPISVKVAGVMVKTAKCAAESRDAEIAARAANQSIWIQG